MNNHFVRVAAAIPAVKVADCCYNTEKIEALMRTAEEKAVSVITFPELSVTGYTCGDLFAQQLLLEKAEEYMRQLLQRTADLDIIAIVGLPVCDNGVILNAAVVFQHGRILGIVPKTYLPNYKEFYEKRWFTSATDYSNCELTVCGQTVPVSPSLLFRTKETTFGIEICEDLWAAIPASSKTALAGAEIIFNLSADNEGIAKHDYLRSLIAQQSARCLCGYVFSSCGFGESTTDLVFAGNGLIYENGTLLAESERFSFDEQLIFSEIDVDAIRNDRKVNTTFAACMAKENATGKIVVADPVNIQPFELTRKINPHPFIPSAGADMDNRCKDIFSIQVAGLAKRLVHTNTKSVVVGISGGLDSTLALLVCIKTFDKLGLPRTGITGVTMPGFGTTDRTYNNSIQLMKSLGITIREVSIKAACIQHFNDIGHDISQHDVTYENSQARERTQILMDIANQTWGLVVGTGDLSELALGWATYNGDHMSMYGVNASIPKTLVKHLVKWVANSDIDKTSRETLLDIIDTPISPELIPADEQGNIKQKTEDLVGPYELHDFFLYYTLRFGYTPKKIFFLANTAFKGAYSKEVIKHWLTTFFRRFFNQQFKRSCLPDGPKVGLSLSPRGDWRMPSDASSQLWLKECEEL